MIKYLVTILASAVIMTTAGATTIDTQMTVKEAPEVSKVSIKSGTSGFETARKCPPFCW